MSDEKRARIYFVDDEPNVRKAVEVTLQRQYEVVSFPDASACLEAMEQDDCDLVITDVNMPGMDGLELLAQIKRINPVLPVLVITGYGDIPMAVRAVKLGAADFIEKPLDKSTLISLVENVLERNQPIDQQTGRKLTPTEKKILRLMLTGKTNREIADVLHRSVRTVEDHRGRIMRKLNVRNIVELMRVATNMDLTC